MTEVNVENLFSSLADSASTLNSYSDSCNKKLKDVQDRLVSLNIGLEFWLKEPIFRSDQKGDIGAQDTSTEVIKRVGFSRINSSWVLGVKTVRSVSGFYMGDMECPYTNEYVDEAPTPLLEASRELRLSAVRVLPEFLVGFNKHVRQVNAELSQSQSIA